MRIAIPVANGELAMHFGHCQQFALIDLNMEEKTIEKTEFIDAPPHQPGLLPPWLAERGAEVIIAGGMGQRAITLFNQRNIKVVGGAPAGQPEAVAKAWLDGSLQSGTNCCDH